MVQHVGQPFHKNNSSVIKQKGESQMGVTRKEITPNFPENEIFLTPDTQTERQTERQRERETERDRERQRETEREAERETERERQRETET